MKWASGRLILGAQAQGQEKGDMTGASAARQSDVWCGLADTLSILFQLS